MACHTRYQKEEVIKAVRKMRGRMFLTAAYLKITIQTLDNYANRWSEVRAAIDEAKGKMIDVAERKLYQAVKKGEAWAICFFLKTQGKSRGYIERQEQNFTGTVHQTTLTAKEIVKARQELEDWERAFRERNGRPGEKVRPDATEGG